MIDLNVIAQYLLIINICDELKTQIAEAGTQFDSLTVAHAASIAHPSKLLSHDFGKIERGLPHSGYTILPAQVHLHHNDNAIAVISNTV